MIDDRAKLILALQQVENCISLLEGNMYETYMTTKLVSVKYELERQLKGGKQL